MYEHNDQVSERVCLCIALHIYAYLNCGTDSQSEAKYREQSGLEFIDMHFKRLILLS
jgi:hypothetical protein